MKCTSLRILDASGSAESIGHAHGAAHRDRIVHDANERVVLVASSRADVSGAPA